MPTIETGRRCHARASCSPTFRRTTNGATAMRARSSTSCSRCRMRRAHRARQTASAMSRISSGRKVRCPSIIEESAGARDALADLLPDGDGAHHGRAAARSADLLSERAASTTACSSSTAMADVVARYDKWRLVPGGEFLPFEWLLEPLGFRKVVTVPGSFAAGPGPMHHRHSRRSAGRPAHLL